MDGVSEHYGERFLADMVPGLIDSIAQAALLMLAYVM